jgi:hypothetical protein
MQERQSAEAQNNCSFFLDTSEAKNQLDEFMELLKTRFPDGVPSEIFSNLTSLTLDVVFTEGRSTVGANGTIKVFQGFRFGSRFERLRTAVLTGEWDVHNANAPSKESSATKI